MANRTLVIALSPEEGEMCASLMFWAMAVLRGDFESMREAGELFETLEDLTPIAGAVGVFMSELRSAATSEAVES